MLFNTSIGVDLGTSSVLIYIRGKGIVMREPSVLAIDTDLDSQVVAVGETARKMIGRTPSHIMTIRPLKEGVISDYRYAEKMLKYFIQKAIGRRFRNPVIAVCVPSGVTEVERKAVRDAAVAAGARQPVHVIEEPIAAAIGAGIDISRPRGSMIVDIGGGTSDVAVLSMGGVVVSSSVKTAGENFDEAIQRYIRKKYNILIGQHTAEEVKIRIGAASEKAERRTMEVRGRDLISGLPVGKVIESREIAEALSEPLTVIIDEVRHVLEQTPPELAADIHENGIVLTGGGSLLAGMDKLMQDKIGVDFFVAEDAISCVAIGTGRYIEQLDSGRIKDPRAQEQNRANDRKRR